MSDRFPLVSTEWLAQRLATPEIRVADASWYLPLTGRDARAEYAAAHIPGAVFFDIDALSDKKTGLPHMLPDPETFAGPMRKLGIGDHHLVVFYDGAGIYSAPRAWWMLRAMGHHDVAVLDGGLPKWRAEGRKLESAPAEIRPSQFNAQKDEALIRDFDAVRANLKTHAEQILDARSAARFRGLEPEPRPGVRGGHIPGSLNIPYTDVLTPSGTMRPPGELKELFAERKVDLGRPVVTSCGSGITAAILLLAFEITGAKRAALYDGSWAEWGARRDTPVERD